jgi:DNA-binding CsgD family transcriptional regulator
MFAGAAGLTEELFGGVGQPSDASGFAMLNGLWWLLSNVALGRPVALFVDDVHWADRGSIQWLSFLGPRIAEIPALVVAAGRTDEPDAPPEWRELATVAGRVIELAPLSESATGELIGGWLGTRPEPEFGAACHAATAGNPFLLTELARELAGRGVEPTRAEAAAVAAVAPGTVAQSVLGRLGREPEMVGRLARAVAVLGDDVPVAHAADLAGLDEAGAGEAAVRLVELGILRRSDRLVFEHPIVRDAVYESIVPFVRAGMHARAARILGARGENVERRAAHLLLSDPDGDAEVVSVLRAAGDAAASRGAVDAAVEYLRRALAEPPGEEERPGVLLALGEVEIQRGQPEAVEHLREALATGAPAIAARAVATLGRWLVLSGDFTGAIELADQPSAFMRDPALRLEVETSLMASASLTTAEVWAKLSDRFRSLKALATDAGDEGLAVLALLATDEIRRGGPLVASAELATAALQGDRLLARGPDYPPFLHAVYALIRSGRGDQALPILERALAASRRRGSLIGFAFASNYRGMAYTLQSRLVAAEGEFRIALEAARDNGWTILQWQALGMYLVLLAERGELEVGQAELERAGADGELPAGAMAIALRSGRATFRYAQGRWREAYDDFVECGRSEGPYSDRSQFIWWRADAAMALAHLGEHAEALALAEAEVAIQRERGDQIALGRALHALGLARAEAGIQDLETAVEVLDGIYDTGLAAALVDLGATLRRLNRRAESRAPLRRALEIAERIGSRRYAEAARTELTASGARARNVIRTGVDSLTPSEFRICTLAASGLSNPEIAQQLFVTRKTVETHLGHAYMKLDIKNRDELAGVLTR